MNGTEDVQRRTSSSGHIVAPALGEHEPDASGPGSIVALRALLSACPQANRDQTIASFKTLITQRRVRISRISDASILLTLLDKAIEICSFSPPTLWSIGQIWTMTGILQRCQLYAAVQISKPVNDNERRGYKPYNARLFLP